MLEMGTLPITRPHIYSHSQLADKMRQSEPHVQADVLVAMGMMKVLKLIACAVAEYVGFAFSGAPDY